MAKIDPFTPTAADKFTFGLWTVGKTGSDPFGGDVREQLTPAQIVDLLGKAGGVHGVNFHDNDLIP
ncbi:MAG TPA: xylose isomerase, partial [Phycisphaerales bacterium]|nr:xylose isomerase [Phycisphaerales bacterium]